MNRTTWLDGLRGLAAAIVATDHYFMGGVLDAGFRSFWADPPEDNRHLYQLPPLRLFFAAHAMVPLFLVISGFAISVNLLRARNSSAADFVRRLASAATRRVLRIYLPVLSIAVISQVIFFCNLYQWEFPDDVVWGRRPWTAPWFHVTFIGRYMLDNLNIIYLQNNGGLNGQLWTMALEFRGSCVVYLVILALAFWRPGVRRLALLGLMTFWYYFGLWDIFGFLAGLYLAEGHVASESASDIGETDLPRFFRPIFSSKTRLVRLTTVWTYACFLLGLWLLCLGDDGFLTPGYQFLELISSERWDGAWGIVNKIWKTTGSILIVYAIRRSPLLQRPLNTRAVQFLGRVSFSLYLVHQSVYHMIRNPVRDALWYLAAGEPYGGVAVEQHPFAFAFAWVGGYIVLSAVNLYVAHLYTRFIDERCIDLAKRFDRYVTQ